MDSNDLTLWRFKDLKQRGIVDNRTTLSRWIKRRGFPPGVKIGDNTRAWTPPEVIDWYERQRAEG